MPQWMIELFQPWMVAVLGVIIIVVIIFNFVEVARRKKEIKERIIKMGGVVNFIKMQGHIVNRGPFSGQWVGKHNQAKIFRFTYMINNTEKIGWVRFNVFSNAEWHFDVEEWRY